MPATLELEKDLPALPESKDHARTPAPRRPSHAAPYPPSPADQGARLFPEKATPSASTGPADPTLAPAPAAPPVPPERQAGAIARALFPSLLAAALQMDRYFDAKGFQAFLDGVIVDAGGPTDPIEVMLLQQLVLAHLRAAQLQAHAGMAEGLEAARLYNAAAARLLAELRKTALALKSYREGPARRGRSEDAPSP